MYISITKTSASINIKLSFPHINPKLWQKKMVQYRKQGERKYPTEEENCHTFLIFCVCKRKRAKILSFFFLSLPSCSFIFLSPHLFCSNTVLSFLRKFFSLTVLPSIFLLLFIYILILYLTCSCNWFFVASTKLSSSISKG